jgi:FlaA1/EpsC-like NDP-sugar epimerase
VRITLARHGLYLQAGIDVVAWAIGLSAAMVLRFDFALHPQDWGRFDGRDLLGTILLAGLLQVIMGLAGGLYRGRGRFGSFDEVAHVVAAAAGTTLALVVVNHFVFEGLVPASLPVVGGLLALFLMFAARYVSRLFRERRLRPSGDHLSRVLVFGAGEGGAQLIASMLRNPDSPYLPIALVDDDPTKQNLRIMGVPVVGNRFVLAAKAKELHADALVIAVPSAGGELLRELSEIALDAGLDVRILPKLHDLLDGQVGLDDLRPLTEADLLGRHQIETDLESISGYITSRRVLVTGAGGSIGGELCVQLARFAPERLVMLDRDESGLHAVQLRHP